MSEERYRSAVDHLRESNGTSVPIEAAAASEQMFASNGMSEDKKVVEGAKDETKGGKGKKPPFDWRCMEKWQKNRLFGSLTAILLIFGVFLVITCNILYQDKAAEDDYWNTYMTEDPALVQKVQEFSTGATQIQVASYLEQIRSIDIKGSQFEVVLVVAFRWDGAYKFDAEDNNTVRFYKGSVKSTQVVEESHENGVNYQQVRYNVVISKQFDTVRFPLGSHQLRVYLEPSANVNEVVLVPDAEASYTNPNLGISGYEMTRFGVAQSIVEYRDSLMNPEYDGYADGSVYKTELMTQFEVNRDGFGLYLKCFIALYGTAAWILLCLYICTFRRVDPLGMIGAAFFGAVSNIMVGASLVPDALDMGLLEFGNLFGVGIIIAGASVVIGINAIRKEKSHEGFAKFYGRIMLAVFVVVIIVGNVALPLSAYLL